MTAHTQGLDAQPCRSPSCSQMAAMCLSAMNGTTAKTAPIAVRMPERIIRPRAVL